MPQRVIIVRLARPDDAPALKAILRDTFESTWRPNITPDAARAHVESGRAGKFVDENGQAFLVAEVDGAVVGLAHWRDDFVHALHVRASHARQGVGGLLMDRVEDEIARAGFAAVRLETDTFNTNARAFYAARGYSEAALYPDEEWNSGLTTVLMVKTLT